MDVEQDDFHLDDDYDVIIALHLIEHLLEPERFMQRLASFARSDAVVIGGFPVTPDWAAPAWERHLRRTIWRTPENYGHVSVFSPQRVSRMAATCGWKLEFLTGAFLIRKTGAFIENHAFWARLNLLWGAAFPALGGEIYWRMRRA